MDERVGINTSSTKRIDPALKPGEKITLQKTADYIGVFPDKLEWLSVLVAQPIGIIDYWVHFYAHDMPKEVWEHHYNVASSRHFDVFPIELETNVAHIRVHNPDMKKAYVIRWEWN